MLSEELADLDRQLSLRERYRVPIGICIAMVVVFGVVLRFKTTSALWLDEALTVDIARLPLHQLPSLLKQDGAPPAYYVLLHFWMRLFGDSDFATRSLSGVISTLTLPVAWLAARRVAGRIAAWTVVVLLASAPFAVYYATEARMYSLVIFLTACGVLALHKALHGPRPGNLVALGAVTAGLLYSQYWALYLVAIVGLWLAFGVWTVWRAERSSWRSAPQFAALAAVAVGCLAFVPWIPTFIYQSQHTGTPWAKPANFSAVLNAVTGYTDNQASLFNVVTNQGRLLALLYFAMAALALFGVARNRQIIDLDLHTVPRARGLALIIVGTLFSAIAGGLLSSSVFSSRYAAIVFLPLLILVALGTTTLLSPRVRLTVVAIAVLAGAVACVENITTQRTQAPDVAAVINATAKPGDVVAFCPDQLGPAVYRVTRDPGQYEMYTFPRRTGPQVIDWVDYLSTVNAADPSAFSTFLLREAGPHEIWLVWQTGYQGYGPKCSQIANNLLDVPGEGGHNWVIAHPHHFYEPMNLTQYAPPRG